MLELSSSLLSPLLLGIDWLDPQWLLDRFGSELFWLAMVIIFVECGLFFPFLPGDALLFSLGIFIATGRIDLFPGSRVVEVLIAMALLIVAAIAGNACGYEIGRKIGEPLREHDGRIIKRKHLDRTHEFFERRGSQALVIGRFLAFVRTYVTVVAGVTRMERHRFYTWTAVGGVAWVVSILGLGALLGDTVPWLEENIDLVIIVIVAFTVVPIAWEWWHQRRHSEDAATPS